MNINNKMILYGMKLPTHELFLFARDEAGEHIPPQRLKTILFSWDSRSFYGTLLETSVWNQHRGLLLSPFWAVLYLDKPPRALTPSLEWSQELLQLQKIAHDLLEVLHNGWFVPSFESWKRGTTGWKIQKPNEQSPSTSPHSRDTLHEDSRHLDAWFQAILLDMLQQEPEVNAALEAVFHQNTMLQVPFDSTDTVWLDEEQWLVQIGWKRDDVPFQMSIQLVEPNGGREAWHLRLLLQGLDDPNLLMETNFKGEPLQGAIPDSWSPYLEQKIAQEMEILTQIVPTLVQTQKDAENPYVYELDDEQAWHFLQHDSLRFKQVGRSVLLPSWWMELQKRPPRLKAKVKSASGLTRFGLQQLMEFDWKVAIGDLELSDKEFLRILADKKRLVAIRGRWVHFDQHFVEQVIKSIARVKKNHGLTLRDALELHWLGTDAKPTLKTAPTDDSHALTNESDFRIEIELNDHLQKLVNQLQQTSSLPLVKVPADLQATLREYQIEGVSWMLFLRRYGLGCCLADDMGLGKTIQFITYLLHAKLEKTDKPALLVCPTSVLGNWEKELARFAPTLRVHVHYGAQRTSGERFLTEARSVDLVITTYHIAQLDQQDLSRITWDALCLDEAQTIKNAYTKQRAAICQLDAMHRIALTGTPVENRLSELWSIYDFLNPGYLGSLTSFTAKYVHPIERTQNVERIEQLQKLIRPFLLRRVKKDPAIQLDLPEKNEMKTFVTLTAEQGALYENVVQNMFEQLNTLSGIERKGLVLSSMTKLKQICDHPTLYLKDDVTTSFGTRSNKWIRLLEMVRELRAHGDKCIIFTQYVEMGRLLQEQLEQNLNEPVLFLHGGIPKNKRDQLVASFQDMENHTASLFVLSIKAGGTGLNLTAANHVFHYDRWWNPAVEEQASDRAFRMGQTRDVQVYKFVTLGTLEERIDEMIEFKQGLRQQIVGAGEQWITEMSTDQLQDLFRLRKEWIEE